MWDLVLIMLSELGCKFQQHPHRTLLSLAFPVMGSLVAEPIAALTDTVFVERLGAVSASGLGAATMVLFGTTWVFNFLNVGTQTEVARAAGSGDRALAAAWARLSLQLAVWLGLLLTGVLWLGMGPVLSFMSDRADIQQEAAAYLSIRALGAPAMLVTFAACGALRGLSLMRLPLWITALSAGLNVLLDPLLIFGPGPLPAYGIRGAAAATVVGQVIAAVTAIALLRRALPFALARKAATQPRARQLMHIGGDMMLRTGALLLFMLLATRAALQEGPATGAAHQGVRQVWMFLAFLLDAFAASAQSLVAYFLGSGQRQQARNVATLVCRWGIGTGLVLLALMLPAGEFARSLLVPPEAYDDFDRIWWICALAQPINALSFVTDGLHWGASEYRYLRNAMLTSSALGIGGLLLLPTGQSMTLALIWWTSMAFLASRAALGVLRVFPGFGPVWGAVRPTNPPVHKAPTHQSPRIRSEQEVATR